MIRLVEYTRSTVKLQKRDLDYLLALLKGGSTKERKILESIAPTSEDGYFELTPGPFVGRIGLPSGESIDIESRFPFTDVIRLISFSGRLPAVLEAPNVEMVGDRFLIDLIAEAFVREVQRVVGHGLAKGYVPRRFLEPPYPGRLDITHHLNHFQGRPDRLVTLAHRLTPDIEVNRAIAAALNVLARAPFVQRAIGSKVSRLAAAFRPVTISSVTAADIRRLRLSRLHSYYSDALPLAALILEGHSLAPTGTGLSGASILFRMPQVWEDCVLRWAREKWGPEYRVEPQHRFDLSSGGEMKSAADVVVWEGRTLLALYDAKYKVPGGTPDVSDVYQMVTYCERLGLPEATLIYPLALEAKEFRVGGRVVRMLGLHQVVDALGDQPELVAAG